MESCSRNTLYSETAHWHVACPFENTFLFQRSRLRPYTHQVLLCFLEKYGTLKIGRSWRVTHACTHTHTKNVEKTNANANAS